MSPNFTVLNNTTYNYIDTGMYKSALGGLVLEDVDADGMQGSGELGIPGVTVPVRAGAGCRGKHRSC